MSDYSEYAAREPSLEAIPREGMPRALEHSTEGGDGVWATLRGALAGDLAWGSDRLKRPFDLNRLMAQTKWEITECTQSHLVHAEYAVGNPGFAGKCQGWRMGEHRAYRGP